MDFQQIRDFVNPAVAQATGLQEVDNLQMPVPVAYVPVQIVIDGALSLTSENPVQNKVIAVAIQNLDGRITAIEGQFSEGVTEAVNNWLAAHPEATTTVQDGAITYAKLDANLKGEVDQISDLKSALDEAIEDFAVPTQEAVDNWLGRHPEATTTVQDGSLTEAKFTESLKLKTIKDYVTPEMFGAVGDGVSDDSTAFQNCLNYAKEHFKPIYLSGESYKITRTLTVGKGTVVNGKNGHSFARGSIILYTGTDVLFTGENERYIRRVTFDGVNFQRVRSQSEKDTVVSAGQYGSICESTECVFRNCGFIGLRSILKGGTITVFSDCAVSYCKTLLEQTQSALVQISFEGLNAFQIEYCVYTEDHNSNALQNISFVDSWVEDFVSVLYGKCVPTLINLVNSTFTNMLHGEEYFHITNTVWRRFTCNVIGSRLLIKSNIANDNINAMTNDLIFSGSNVSYGGDGNEKIKISGNAKWTNAQDQNINAINNKGINLISGRAYTSLYLTPTDVASKDGFGYHSALHMLSYIDPNSQRTVIPPVYRVTDNTIPTLTGITRFFTYNTNAVSTGDVVLRYVDKSLNIVRDIVTI